MSSLKDIVQLILNHQNYISDGTLFVDNITIDQNIRTCIQSLDDNNVIENNSIDVAIGKVVSLELSLAHLNSLGYYEDIERVVVRNRYDRPSALFYMRDLNVFSDDSNSFFLKQYYAVIELITAIKIISKHNFSEIDVEIAIVFREDKSLIIPFNYSAVQLSKLTSEDLSSLDYISNTFRDNNSEKKLLFINELIDFLSPIVDEGKFFVLLEHITEFSKKCNSAYQYYLRDFSYNKLKIELDSKILEFTQKIQAVINDSQTKLIAIPTAFVLVFSTFDFVEILSIENIVSILSLFIFAIIIQIFLNNQYSSLSFTELNIESYKATFNQANLEKFKQKFAIVDQELLKQRSRLNIVTLILWILPVSLSIIWLTMVYHESNAAFNLISAMILKYMIPF